MGTSLDLLKMLEPAVRPVGPAPTRSGGAGTPPLEARSFGSLLEEAQSAAEPGSPSEVEGKAEPKGRKCDPLASLGGLDRIENESLLRIVNGSANGAGMAANDAVNG